MIKNILISCFLILLLLNIIKIVCLILFYLCVFIAIILNIPVIYEIAVKLLFKTCITVEENFSDIPKEPCFIMSNYPNGGINALFLNYISHKILPFKNVFLVASHCKKTFIHHLYEKDKLIYVDTKKKNNYDEIKSKINFYIENKYHIFCYIEEVSRESYNIKKFRSGMFNIAKELNIPIVPIVMDTLNLKLFFTMPKFTFYVGKKMYVEDVEKTKKEVMKWMQKKLNTMIIKT